MSLHYRDFRFGPCRWFRLSPASKQVRLLRFPRCEGGVGVGRKWEFSRRKDDLLPFPTRPFCRREDTETPGLRPEPLRDPKCPAEDALKM